MKLTVSELKNILSKKPVTANEEEIKEVFSLLGFTLKEYSKAGLSPYQRYEVHYGRYYVIRVSVDNSRCMSLRNEYVDFGDSNSGLSFGGIDTVIQVLQTVVLMIAPKMNVGYAGQVSFNEDESEYTEAEFSELLEALNSELFSHAEY